MGPHLQVKCLKIELLSSCGMDLEELALWSLGTLEVSEGVFGSCKCFLIFCFCLNVWCEHNIVPTCVLNLN